MKATNKENEIFVALLGVASQEAMRRELDALPSNEELNEQYKSDMLDAHIYKLVKQVERSKIRRRLMQAIGKIVAGVAIVFTVMTTILMSVEATRVRIINAIIDWQADHVKIEPSNSSDYPEQNDNLSRPAYLPKGFFEAETIMFGNTIEKVYRNDDGVDIKLIQKPAEAATLNLDNEYTGYKNATISGNDAHIFIPTDDDTSSMIIWIAEDTLYELYSHISIDELILIAESIK